MNTRTMKRWLLVATALSLAACGSDGGDEDDGFARNGPLTGGTTGSNGGTGNTGPVAAAGLWYGMNLVDGATLDRPMIALVTEEGDFIAAAEIGDFMVADFVGTASGTGDDFSGNTSAYLNYEPRGNASFSGTVVAGVSLTGTYTFDTTSAEFTLNYSDIYERPASLATVQGVYSYTSSGGAVTVVIQANGSLSGNTFTGCDINGTVTVPRADRNYYRFTGSLSNCIEAGAMHGLIYLDDDANSPVGSNDLLTLIGETNNDSSSVFVTGSK